MRSLVKAGGGDERNVARHRVGSSSKPSDRTRSVSGSIASRSGFCASSRRRSAWHELPSPGSTASSHPLPQGERGIGRYLRIILLPERPSITHSSTEDTNHESSYFADTDTLYIEFRDRDIVQSKIIDENTVLDLDSDGNVCAITFEHAGGRTGVHHLTVEGIAA
jgi:uncharacterized protein YuzE